MGKLGITLNFTTFYHPQSDGQSEKLNQCIETYLRCMVFDNPKKWTKWLALTKWWYNTNYHTTLKTTPFETLYGYAPPYLLMGSAPKGSNPAITVVLVDKQEALQQLKVNLIKAQARMKKYADMKRSERRFSVGDWV
jgi:hypothetical protein